MSVSVLADREQMPDPEFYRSCLDAAWEELVEALLKMPEPQPAPAAPRRKSATGAADNGKPKPAAVRRKSASGRAASKPVRRARSG